LTYETPSQQVYKVAVRPELPVVVDVLTRIGVADDAIEQMANGVVTDLWAGFRSTVVLPEYWVQIRSQHEKKQPPARRRRTRG